MPGRIYWIAAIFALATVACSSSKTQPEQDSPELQTMESSADSVGSIPEDMLAEEEAAGDTAEPDAALATDPFADLKEEEKPSEGEALAVIEDGESAPAGGQMEQYTVKAGDTLMKIAFTLYGDIDRWKELFDWNRDVLNKASRLDVGMTLKYEAPPEDFQREQYAHSYLIKAGDTLAGIADEVYGRKMKYKKLQNYNRRLIKDPNRIFAGFTLYYDITPQEMAEAEARRQEKAAQAASGGWNTPSDTVPSALTPPAETTLPAAPPVAVSPVPPAPSSVAPPPAPAPLPLPPAGQ